MGSKQEQEHLANCRKNDAAWFNCRSHPAEMTQNQRRFEMLLLKEAAGTSNLFCSIIGARLIELLGREPEQKEIEYFWSDLVREAAERTPSHKEELVQIEAEDLLPQVDLDDFDLSQVELSDLTSNKPTGDEFDYPPE